MEATLADMTREVASLRAKVEELTGPREFSQAELLWNLVGALALSLIINACFFVAEIGALCRQFPNGRLVDAYAHIFTGPIAFIAFIDGRSFVGTFTFFLALWHFLCHTGRGCPSYVLAGPGETRYEAWWWFECLLICVHHVYIGTGKLAFDLGYFDGPGGEGVTLSEKVIFAVGMKLWLGGACFVHLSMGMKLLSIRGSVLVRVFSTCMRFGGQALLIATHAGAIRAGMILDMSWLVIMIITLLTFPRQPLEKDSSEDVPRPEPIGSPAQDRCASDVAGSTGSQNSLQRNYGDLHCEATDTKMRRRALRRATGSSAGDGAH